MEQNYTPRPPRICPGCGSAVADGFDNCPTCGYAMPTRQGAAPMTQQQPLVTPTHPQGQGYYPYEVPEGATIVSDRKTYFAHYLPRQQYGNIATMAVLSLVAAIIIGAMILLGASNNIPALFLFNTLAVTALSIWLFEKMDIASSVVCLVYTVIFFFVSLAVFDHAYFYPIIAAVIALTGVVKGNQSWKAYQRAPIPMAAMTAEDEKKHQKRQKGYRIAIIALAVVLVAMSVVMFVFKSNEEAQHEGYTVGEVNGDTYTNDFAGINFTAPKGWYTLDQEELEEYNFAYFGFSYDPESYAILMYSMNSDDFDKIEETYEYMVLYTTKHGRKQLAEEYFDGLIDEMKSYYGDYVTMEELESVDMNGITYRVLHTHYQDEETDTDFHEYILIGTKGCYTFELYLYPEGNTTYEDLLACFGAP